MQILSEPMLSICKKQLEKKSTRKIFFNIAF